MKDVGFNPPAQLATSQSFATHPPVLDEIDVALELNIKSPSKESKNLAALLPAGPSILHLAKAN